MKALIASGILLASHLASATNYTYHYSGQACQGTVSTDRGYLNYVGAGVTNPYAGGYYRDAVVCPVMGVQSTSFHEIGFSAHVINGIDGYWEIDNLIGSVTWYTPSHSNITGNADITWSGSDLDPSLITSWSSFSLLAGIVGKCDPSLASCSHPQSYIQQYSVTLDAP